VTKPAVAAAALLNVESVLGTTGATAWSTFGSSLAVSGDTLVVSAPNAELAGDSQVIEKTDVTFDAPGASGTQVLRNACKLQRNNPRLVGAEGLPLPGFTLSPEEYEFEDVIPSPLQSRVVQIRFPNEMPGVVVQVEGDPGYAYNVYLRNDEGCVAVSDNNARVFRDLDANSIVYVLVANTLYSNGPITYRITVACGDGPCG
jgi:hypothetical protein